MTNLIKLVVLVAIVVGGAMAHAAIAQYLGIDWAANSIPIPACCR